LQPGREVVALDQRYYRPAEVVPLSGDPSRARSELGWQPNTTFEKLLREVVGDDHALADSERAGRKLDVKIHRLDLANG